MSKYKMAMDRLLLDSINNGCVRIGFVGDEPYLIAQDLCMLFSDADLTATIATVEKQHIQMIEFDDCALVGVDEVGTDIILLGIQPDTSKALPKQLEHVDILNGFKNEYYIDFLDFMAKSDTGLNTDTLNWCADHPEEANKALNDLYKNGNFDVPDELQPFVRLYMITHESKDAIPGVAH